MIKQKSPAVLSAAFFDELEVDFLQIAQQRRKYKYVTLTQSVLFKQGDKLILTGFNKRGAGFGLRLFNTLYLSN